MPDKHNNKIQFAMLVMLCFITALYAARNVDFAPMNGTFQNYNPVRRLLDGQIPFKDFADYLGLGHLYLGAGLTGILGGSFRGSLIAFNMLSSLSFVLISSLLGTAVLGRKRDALNVTGICFVVMAGLLYCVRKIFPELLSPLLMRSINYFLATGNSARFVRALVIPIVMLIVISCEKIVRVSHHKGVLSSAGAGVIGGFAFTYGNDFGISCWVCMHIMTFVVAISRSRKLRTAVCCTFLEIFVSVMCILLSAWIFTAGHLQNWMSVIMQSGGYQAWYYNSGKSYYVYQADYAVLFTQGTLSIVYLLKIFARKGDTASIKRYGLPAFANIVSCCAANEYRLMSGNFLREPSMIILIMTIIFETLFIKNQVGRIKSEESSRKNQVGRIKSE